MKPQELSEVKTQVMDKGTNTNQINITTHKNGNLVEVIISSDVEVQVMKNPSALTMNQQKIVINKPMQAYEE